MLDCSQHSRMKDQAQCFLNFTAIFCEMVRDTDAFCHIWKNKARVSASANNIKLQANSGSV